MARIGYARVSSVGRSLDMQLEKLAGCKKVYQEKASASGKRPQLDVCLDSLRDGDTLVVIRLDRLARSTLETSVYRYLSPARDEALSVS